MSVDQLRAWIELISGATIPAVILGVTLHRIKGDWGLSLRSMQYMATAIVPLMLIFFTVAGFLEKDAVGTLLGAYIGYLLSGLGSSSREDGPSRGS